MHVHDRKDSDVIQVVHENDCVGKIVAEMPPCWRIKFPETLGIRRNLQKQSLHLAIKTQAQFG